MKLMYKQFIIILIVLGFVLALVYGLLIQKAHSEIKRANDRVQTLEDQMNTVGVAEREEVVSREGYEGICELSVVVCKDEEFSLKLQ